MQVYNVGNELGTTGCRPGAQDGGSTVPIGEHWTIHYGWIRLDQTNQTNQAKLL